MSDDSRQKMRPQPPVLVTKQPTQTDLLAYVPVNWEERAKEAETALDTITDRAEKAEIRAGKLETLMNADSWDAGYRSAADEVAAAVERVKELEKELEETQDQADRLSAGQDKAVLQAMEYERGRLRGIIESEPEYPTDWDQDRLDRYASLIASGEATAQTLARAAVADTKRSLLEKLK